MLPLLRVGLSLATFCAALVLAVYAVACVWTAYVRSWPDLEGPTFELSVGREGEWKIDWPERGPLVVCSELYLVVDPVVDPGAVDVLIIAEDPSGAATCHAPESIGAPSVWMMSGVATLPARVTDPLLFRHYGIRPVQRVSWVVTRVGSTAVGARAHLAVRGEPGRSRTLDTTIQVLSLVLPSCALFFAATAVFFGLNIHRRSRDARSSNTADSPRRAWRAVWAVSRTTLGALALIAAFAAALAGVVAATALVGRLTQESHEFRFTSRGGNRGPFFELTPGVSGTWVRERDADPELPGNELLWLGTDSQRQPPDPREIEIYVRVEPPEAAWSLDPGPRPESGEWRLGPREDEGRALVVDPRRVERVTWRVASLTEEWMGSTAWLEVCGSCDQRRATDGEVP